MSGVDEQARTGVCVICGPVKAYLRKDKNQWICAKNSAERSRESRRRYWSSEAGRLCKFRNRHGLTKEQAAAAIALKGDRCDICDREAELNYDHCHVSLEHRGWLCDPCNLGLGKFGDDPERLRAAAAYLERAFGT